MNVRDEALDLTSLVAEIVASYVSNHLMNSSEIPPLIRLVHQSLVGITSGNSYSLSANCNPAVPIENSINPDYIICLEDGRRMKMLKRHLRTAYNMTPEQYRERWSLPVNYPMTAPNYAKRRSLIAKTVGLGTHQKGQKKTAA